MQLSELHIFENQPEAYISAYLHTAIDGTSRIRPAMVVCPGGGYHFLSGREAEPIALRYLQAGFNVFILYYSIGANAKDYCPIIQAAQTICYIRTHADELSIDPRRVFIVGFSAGGHLAATTGTLFNSAPVRQALQNDDPTLSIPNGMILCYPVINAGEWAHKGSIDYLCGDPDTPQEVRDQFSLEKYVSNQTPPTFIWHTSPDATVPVMNSLLFAEQLSVHQVPFEMRIYPEGGHGLATADKETNSITYTVAEEWLRQSIRWIQSIT